MHRKCVKKGPNASEKVFLSISKNIKNVHLFLTNVYLLSTKFHMQSIEILNNLYVF